MATQRTPRTSSEAKAELLLARAASWSRGTAITAHGETVGLVLFASATRPGVVYLTRCDGRACSCLAYQRGGRTCCHILAVSREAASAREAATTRLEDLWDDHLDERARPLVDAF
jgi:hypothetical protein